MSSRSSKSRSMERTSAPTSTAAERRKVLCQVREHLEKVSMVCRRTTTTYNSQCGHATYSSAKECWAVQHVEHVPGGNGKKTLVAELYDRAEKKNKYKQTRRLPPVDLVESLLMNQELKSWARKARTALKDTPGEAQRFDYNVEKIDNLFFQDKDGKVINFAVFVSILNRKENTTALLDVVVSPDGDSELWQTARYKDWIVEAANSTNAIDTDKGTTAAAVAASSKSPMPSSTSPMGASILENVGISPPSKRSVTVSDPPTEPSPRSKRQKLDPNRLSEDSLHSLPPAITSPVSRPVRSDLAALAEVASAKKQLAATKNGKKAPSPTGRPPALESSSESDHTVDDETKEAQNKEQANASTPSPLIPATTPQVAGEDECASRAHDESSDHIRFVATKGSSQDKSSCLEQREGGDAAEQPQTNTLAKTQESGPALPSKDTRYKGSQESESSLPSQDSLVGKEQVETGDDMQEPSRSAATKGLLSLSSQSYCQQHLEGSEGAVQSQASRESRDSGSALPSKDSSVYKEQVEAINDCPKSSEASPEPMEMEASVASGNSKHQDPPVEEVECKSSPQEEQMEGKKNEKASAPSSQDLSSCKHQIEGNEDRKQSQTDGETVATSSLRDREQTEGKIDENQSHSNDEKAAPPVQNQEQRDGNESKKDTDNIDEKVASISLQDQEQMQGKNDEEESHHSATVVTDGSCALSSQDTCSSSLPSQDNSPRHEAKGDDNDEQLATAIVVTDGPPPLPPSQSTLPATSSQDTRQCDDQKQQKAKNRQEPAVGDKDGVKTEGPSPLPPSEETAPASSPQDAMPCDDQEQQQKAGNEQEPAVVGKDGAKTEGSSPLPPSEETMPAPPSQATTTQNDQELKRKEPPNKEDMKTKGAFSLPPSQETLPAASSQDTKLCDDQKQKAENKQEPAVAEKDGAKAEGSPPLPPSEETLSASPPLDETPCNDQKQKVRDEERPTGMCTKPKGASPLPPSQETLPASPSQGKTPCDDRKQKAGSELGPTGNHEQCTKAQVPSPLPPSQETWPLSPPQATTLPGGQEQKTEEPPSADEDRTSVQVSSETTEQGGSTRRAQTKAVAASPVRTAKRRWGARDKGAIANEGQPMPTQLAGDQATDLNAVEGHSTVSRLTGDQAKKSEGDESQSKAPAGEENANQGSAPAVVQQQEQFTEKESAPPRNLSTRSARSSRRQQTLGAHASASRKQTLSLRRSKRPHAGTAGDEDAHPPARQEEEARSRIALRKRKSRVRFSEEENEWFPHEPDKPLRIATRSRRGREHSADTESPANLPPAAPERLVDSPQRPTRQRRKKAPTEIKRLGATPAPATEHEEQKESPGGASRPRRHRAPVERYTDVRSEKLEEMLAAKAAAASEEDPPSRSVRSRQQSEKTEEMLSPALVEPHPTRNVRSRRSRDQNDTMEAVAQSDKMEEMQATASEEETRSRGVARARRHRAPVERYTDSPARDSQTCLVRIKVQGEDLPDPLEAVMADEGIPQNIGLAAHAQPSSSTSKYSFRARKSQTYFEDEGDSDDDGPILVRTPFVLNRKNFLKVDNLVRDYEEVCYKRHGTCFSMRNVKDINARASVDSLARELEVLDRKFPMEEEEEDEDIIAEQQLHNKTLRVMQRRRSQERSMRMKEKEQEKHMANLVLQNQWINKKKAPTVEELECEEIVNRPIQFAEARTMRGKRISGKESCPCATTATQRTRDETPPSCRLCDGTTNPLECEDEPVPVKDMMPMVCPIDTDAPEFPNRDEDDDRSSHEREEDRKKARVSQRMKFDPRRRRETASKLGELRRSTDFIEQYNYGLLPKVATGS